MTFRLLLLAAVFLAFWKHERLKHLGVPVWAAPSALSATPLEALVESEPVELTEVAALGSRVTALLTAEDGAVWAGTFDRGVFRDGQPLSCEGRACFVNALLEHEGSIWAATYSGLFRFSPSGQPVAARLQGVAVEALAVHRGSLVAGTVRGLFRGDAEATHRNLRITALAVNGTALWLGTPSGVYQESGTYHPLIFGPTASSSNVVLALAPWRDGVLASTDDGGLVEVLPGKPVHARRFTHPRANEGNPGAILKVDAGAWVGTQGGGLVLLSDAGRASSPSRWPAPIVSALAPGLLGDGSGKVYRVGAPAAAASGLTASGR